MKEVYRVCPKHGMYKVDGNKGCLKCNDENPKKSPKYGNTAIIIPPHMKAGNEND